MASAADLWAAADLVVKVKEPLGPELELRRQGLVPFTYLQLAAVHDLARVLLPLRALLWSDTSG